VGFHVQGADKLVSGLIDDIFIPSHRHDALGNHLLSWQTAQHLTNTKTKLNSVALVRERTMPAERPPLVG
jgi:hypothetical protein